MRSISALAVTLAVCALSAERGAAFAPASPSGAAAATRRATSPFTRENVVVFKRKGKSGVPSSMREQYESAEQAKNQQQIDESKPVFYVFARKPQGVWYPATVFQGDDQATNLIKGWMGEGLGGMFKDNFKGQLDTGIAKSIFGQEVEFNRAVFQQQPQLKKYAKTIEYGYKVKYPGLVEAKPDANEIQPVTKEMQVTWIDGVQDAVKQSPLSGLLGGQNQ